MKDVGGKYENATFLDKPPADEVITDYRKLENYTGFNAHDAMTEYITKEHPDIPDPRDADYIK